MILETLFGMSLVMSASLNSGPPPQGGPSAWTQMSVRQREATLLPLVHSATDCIVNKVTADPRFSEGLRAGEINDLIVDSMVACAGPVRAMIDAHDRLFGYGSGEAFFMGPYLEVLPAAVSKQVKAPVR
ncbi:MAG: hypothetical protein WCI56_08670 [Hyphomicrobiales bacterium]